MGVVLDSNLNFNTHIDRKIKKCDKIIGLARRLSVKVPHSALQYINLSRDLILTMVMSYMINQAMMIFQSKMVKVQYRACLAITGGTQGTSRERLYDELGLHGLVKRRSRNKLVFFTKLYIVYYETTSILN